MSSIDLKSLLGSQPDSPSLKDYLSTLSSEPVAPDVKSYPDAVYFNYFNLGVSLQFKPKTGYKPSVGLKLAEIQRDRLELDSIYIYNTPKVTAGAKPPARSADAAFSGYPISPILLSLSPDAKDKDGKLLDRSSQIHVTRETTGREFVEAMQEPDRKGGGAGPSAGSIGIWCEWTKDGIMVEFGGEEARGPQAWERGKDATWKIITVFGATS